MDGTPFPPPEWLARNREALARYTDETNLINVRPLLARAALAVLGGEPMDELFDAFHRAALCFESHAEAHLYKTPYARFKTRRLEPLEIGLLSGNLGLMREIARQVGLSIDPVLAGMADKALIEEVQTLTRFFERGSTAGDGELAGLGALAYAGALTALLQGFDDEARAVLALFLGEARACGIESRAQVPEALGRYVAIASVLMGWLDDAPDLAQAWLTRLADRDAARRAALALTEDNVHELLNTTLLALIGVGALRQAPLPAFADPLLESVSQAMQGRGFAEGDDAEGRSRLAAAIAERLGAAGRAPDEGGRAPTT